MANVRMQFRIRQRNGPNSHIPTFILPLKARKGKGAHVKLEDMRSSRGNINPNSTKATAREVERLAPTRNAVGIQIPLDFPSGDWKPAVLGMTNSMKTHIQVVAALHIALGALSVIGAIVLFACLGLAGTIVLSQGEPEAAGILAIVAVVLCGFLVLIGLPGIIGGWALFTERSWGRPLVLVLGILELFNIPIGTAVGIYTLWVLLSDAQESSTHLSSVPPAASGQIPPRV